MPRRPTSMPRTASGSRPTSASRTSTTRSTPAGATTGASMTCSDARWDWRHAPLPGAALEKLQCDSELVGEPGFPSGRERIMRKLLGVLAPLAVLALPIQAQADVKSATQAALTATTVAARDAALAELGAAKANDPAAAYAA